jgi:hypothetical protein
MASPLSATTNLTHRKGNCSVNRCHNVSLRPAHVASCLFLMAICLPAIMVGCGRSKRLGVEGTVTLDGKPLPNGNITLTPQQGTASPTAGAMVTQGEFSIPAAGGVLPGKFRVEIISRHRSGRKVPDFRAPGHQGELVDAEEQYLPAKYNSQSELTAEVKSDGPNKLKFELLSR